MKTKEKKALELCKMLQLYIKEKKMMGLRQKNNLEEKINKLSEELGLSAKTKRQLLRKAETMAGVQLDPNRKKYKSKSYQSDPEMFKDKHRRYCENRTKYSLMLGEDEADILSYLTEASKVVGGKKKYVVNAIRFYEKHKDEFDEDDDE